MTNKVNGAHDKANFDFLELVYPNNIGNKLKIIFLYRMSVSILVVDIADNCIFLLGGVTLGQSGWSISKHIEMHVFGKVLSYGLFGTPGRSTSPSIDFYTKNFKKIDFGVLSGPRVGLASVESQDKICPT